jgi:hypothetical protein
MLVEKLLADKHWWVRSKAARNPSAYIFFDDIMSRKTLQTGVFTGFLANTNIIPTLEPHIPDFLRLLEGKEPLLGSVED